MLQLVPGIAFTLNNTPQRYSSREGKLRSNLHERSNLTLGGVMKVTLELGHVKKSSCSNFTSPIFYISEVSVTGSTIDWILPLGPLGWCHDH